jgi:hypothetical protein
MHIVLSPTFLVRHCQMALGLPLCPSAHMRLCEVNRISLHTTQKLKLTSQRLRWGVPALRATTEQPRLTYWSWVQSLWPFINDIKHVLIYNYLNSRNHAEQTYS